MRKFGCAVGIVSLVGFVTYWVMIIILAIVAGGDAQRIGYGAGWSFGAQVPGCIFGMLTVGLGMLLARWARVLMGDIAK